LYDTWFPGLFVTPSQLSNINLETIYFDRSSSREALVLPFTPLSRLPNWIPALITIIVSGRKTQNTMRPEVEQELAHTLLVELLAYQFASPVRWIETQDVILAEMTTERIVEIGPADTLGVMAKRTLVSKYEAYDAAKSVQRQILCYNKDAKEIYYDVDPVEDEPAPTPTGSTPAQFAPAATSTPVAVALPPPSAGPAAQVPDAPVGAIDIVRALVAQKLKKPLLDIPLSKAIKDLVGGE
jgi:fatty acid synthase subunit alpha